MLGMITSYCPAGTTWSPTLKANGTWTTNLFVVLPFATTAEAAVNPAININIAATFRTCFVIFPPLLLAESGRGIDLEFVVAYLLTTCQSLRSLRERLNSVR